MAPHATKHHSARWKDASSRKPAASFILRVIAAISAAVSVGTVGGGASAQVLRTAQIRIQIHTGTSCEVSLEVAVAEVTTVEHRLALFDGDRVELLEVENAATTAQTRAGRTEVLAVRPPTDGGAYLLRYRVELSPARAFRCPVWVPTVPADGISKPIRVQVVLPAGAVAVGDTLPALDWRDNLGTATLGHVPAFVRVPYGPPGSGGWPLTGVMDTTAVGVFVLASGWWLWRRRH